MTDHVWRPLGVDTEEKVVEYDALHDGIPVWMSAAFWRWVQRTITYLKRDPISYHGNKYPWPEPDLTETMCQRLMIALPNIRLASGSKYDGAQTMAQVMSRLKNHHTPLQIADYLLAHSKNADADALETILRDSKSAWKVGTRKGWAGLERRVPEGVQVAADDVMSRSGQAGRRLAEAWEVLYGINPDPSKAYGLAIKAVEDAAVPFTLPNDPMATLGNVIPHVENSTRKPWKLPMAREHDKAPSKEVLVSLMRMLWHGQHDRHGGQLSSPEELSVSQEEATVAVSLAVTLVNMFESGLVTKEVKS